MTTAKRPFAAFTLIEALIVVVVVAVLAATILPQFFSPAVDTKTSAAKFNLQSLRSQIELYRLEHNGRVPSLSAGALPELISATDIEGNQGVRGERFPYGPYLINGLPVNPFTNSATVAPTANSPPIAASGADGGWLYNPATGQVYLDYAPGLHW